MRAWWVYWISIALTAVLWIGLPLIVGRDGLRTALAQPIWLAILLLPLLAAGLNLVFFRETHEEICALEVERHPWLRTIVGRGYSARTFAATGVALLGVVGFVIIAELGNLF